MTATKSVWINSLDATPQNSNFTFHVKLKTHHIVQYASLFRIHKGFETATPRKSENVWFCDFEVLLWLFFQFYYTLLEKRMPKCFVMLSLFICKNKPKTSRNVVRRCNISFMNFLLLLKYMLFISTNNWSFITHNSNYDSIPWIWPQI